MIIRIGNEKISTKGRVMITFINGFSMVVDSLQKEYLYINPSEVKTVIINEEQKG